MNRGTLNLVLAALLVLCGLALVTSQYRARGLFIDLEQAQGRTRALEVEWNQLLLEQTQHGRHGLIESVARRELRMLPATPARTEYLVLPGAVPAPPRAGP